MFSKEELDDLIHRVADEAVERAVILLFYEMNF